MGHAAGSAVKTPEDGIGSPLFGDWFRWCFGFLSVTFVLSLKLDCLKIYFVGENIVIVYFV